ncbi:MAG: PIN domain-containing protein [Planctomycetota bacterium]|nr:MAG: PIN domain-containing protein [Planctomycetota bacterium]
MIVVDASAMIELLLRKQAASPIETRLLGAGASLHAPHLLDLEVAQVLRRFRASRELSVTRAAEALEDYLDLPIRRHSHEILLPRIWQLRGRVTAYDASYLALAESLEAPLVTCDRGMARVSGCTADVVVV